METEKNVSEFTDRRTIGTKALMEMLDVGRARAEKFGSEAGARVQIGRRVVWNVKKIQEHIDEVSGN